MVPAFDKEEKTAPESGKNQVVWNSGSDSKKEHHLEEPPEGRLQPPPKRRRVPRGVRERKKEKKGTLEMSKPNKQTLRARLTKVNNSDIPQPFVCEVQRRME